MFSFSYQGELVDGASQARVQTNLARLFSINEEQASQLFEPDKEFFRDGLDQATAQDYLTMFERAGAVGRIATSAQETQVSPAEVGGVITQIVGANDTQVAENQAWWGTHVVKHIEKAGVSQNTGIAETAQVDALRRRPTVKDGKLDQHKASRAAQWLRIGGLAVVGTMIADEQLQSALIVDRYGLDLGYLPLLLAHIPLIIGCHFLVKEKRLAPILSLLGVLSFAGLSILLLMPAKGDRDHKVSFGALAMTVFSCGLFLYWFGGAVQTSADTSVLYERMAALSQDREEFPSGLMQGQLDTYSAEQAELLELMQDIIDLANSDELRPDQTTKLANSMMNEVAGYIAWRQYQSFLHHTTGKALANGLDREFQKADEQKVGGMLRRVNPQSNKRLYESVQSWTVAPVNEDEYVKTNGLRKQLNNIFDASREGWLEQTEREGLDQASLQSLDKPPAIDVANLKLPRLNGAELKKSKHHVEYNFTRGRLQGKTLAIGFYTVKNESRWNRKVSYSPKYLLLNNGVPATYMSNLISVFNNYAKPQF